MFVLVQELTIEVKVSLIISSTFFMQFPVYSFLTLFCLTSLSLLEITLLFIGVLACLDGYMNIAMEQTEEYVDGQLTSKYGDCFIRGNNGKKCEHVVVRQKKT